MARLDKRREQEIKAFIAIQICMTMVVFTFHMYFLIRGGYSQTKGRKRSRSSTEEAPLTDAMASWLKSMSETLRIMADCIGYREKLSLKRMKVIEDLSKLELTLEQRFKAGAIIICAEERMDSFYGISPDERLDWVLYLLDGQLYPLVC